MASGRPRREESCCCSMEANAQLRSMTSVAGSAVFRPSSMASADGGVATSKCSHHPDPVARHLAPDRPGHPAHELQLHALVIRRQPVAFHGRRKSALWAEGQPIERNEARRFFDPPLQLLLRLERRLLARYQAEHDHAILGYVLQRRKPTRPLIVVLEQEAIEPRPFKYARDRLIVAGGVELALVVAATDVHRERHAGMPLDDRVVHLDAGVDQLFGIAASL